MKKSSAEVDHHGVMLASWTLDLKHGYMHMKSLITVRLQHLFILKSHVNTLVSLRALKEICWSKILFQPVWLAFFWVELSL